jgi:hypothetical protein
MNTMSKLLLLASLLMGGAGIAQAQIFLCVDAQGRRELTDTQRAGCKPLDVPGGFAAPARRGNDQPAKPRAPTMAAATSPADFPRVDNALQRARDDDRRAILNEELRSEEKRLMDLRKEYNNGEPERIGGEKNYQKYLDRVAGMKDNISRSEKNIEALKRELSNIK